MLGLPPSPWVLPFRIPFCTHPISWSWWHNTFAQLRVALALAERAPMVPRAGGDHGDPTLRPSPPGRQRTLAFGAGLTNCTCRDARGQTER